MPTRKKVSEADYSKFRDALNAFNHVADLTRSELAESCLVKKRLAEHPGLSPSEILRESFQEINTVLESIDPAAADIIRGRFFEGLTVGEMLSQNRPKPMAERTFKKHQRQAIFELASLFLQRDAVCRMESQGQPNTPANQPKKNNRLRTPTIVGVALLVIYGIVSFAQKTATPRLCGENTLVEDAATFPRFIYPEGVTTYTAENTPASVLHDRVRAVLGTDRGAIIGYFDPSSEENGLSYFDRSGETKVWADCNASGVTLPARVNDILMDDNNNIWVSTDGQGIFRYNGKKWAQFTPENSGLPSFSTFALTTDPQGQVWVGTTDGVAVFENGDWQPRFKDELFHNQVYSLAFDPNGNIWVGHIFMGISYFDNTEGTWQWFQDSTGELSSNNIRGLMIRPEEDGSQSVWVATDGGGLSVYQQGEWHTIGLEDGLPSVHITDIEIDRFNRVWVATDQGVAYLDGHHWVIYDHLFTHSISFSHGCPDDACPQDDHIWTGTEENGLTHSRLPYLQTTMQVNRICFVDQENNLTCPAFREDKASNTITATYPEPLSPGETFYFEIHVTPINGYQLVLDATRGDSLNFVGGDEAGLYGAWIKIPADGVTGSGETFVFSNRNNHIVAPEIDKAQTISIPWRIWMHTRYTGPTIQIEFSVAP